MSLNNVILTGEEVTVQAIHNTPIDEVTYIITTTDNKYIDDNSVYECVLVDPSNYIQLENYLQKKALIPSWIILTHEHIDHINAVNKLVNRYGSKVACSEECANRIRDPKKNLSSYYCQMLEFHGKSITSEITEYVIQSVDFKFHKNSLLFWHGKTFYLFETPGHSPGSICISIDHKLFTGDSLLRDNKAPTNGPYGNRKDYNEITIPLLREFEATTEVYPGHGETFILKNSKFL